MAPLGLVALLALSASLVNARLQDGRPHGNAPPIPVLPVVEVLDSRTEAFQFSGSSIPPYNTVYYFDQLIDHDDASKGTFSQRYWHTWEFYQPG